MPLTVKQRKFLRAQVHSRKPVVIVGNAGLTTAVIDEIDAALAHHELIKVRVNAGDRAARRAMIEAIVAQTDAELVQTLGHVASFYRPTDPPKLTLPR